MTFSEEKKFIMKLTLRSHDCRVFFSPCGSGLYKKNVKKLIRYEKESKKRKRKVKKVEMNLSLKKIL